MGGQWWSIETQTGKEEGENPNWGGGGWQHRQQGTGDPRESHQTGGGEPQMGGKGGLWRHRQVRMRGRGGQP